MFKIIATLFSSLTFLTAYGQTEIQELKFKLLYNYACFDFNYEMTLPLFNATNANDVRENVNDSIQIIYNSIVSEIPVPSFTDHNDCPTMYIGTQERNLFYSIILNTDTFLSAAIYDSRTAGNGGHGGSTNLYCFNIDLLNNELLTIDSLFNPRNKEKVLKLVETKFDNTQNLTYNNYIGNIWLLGINISDKNFIVHYNVYNGDSVYLQKDIELPLTDIQKLINKKYLRLCGTIKK